MRSKPQPVASHGNGDRRVDAPARVLGLVGDRVDRLRLLFFGNRAREAANPESRVWAAIVRALLRRPWVGLAVPFAVLVLAASPIFGMHIGTSGVTVLPKSSESRQGYTALRRDFPGAAAEPATIVVSSGALNPGAERALQHLRTTLARDPRFGARTIQRSANGTAAVLSVPVSGDPTLDSGGDRSCSLHSCLVAPTRQRLPVPSAARIATRRSAPPRWRREVTAPEALG